MIYLVLPKTDNFSQKPRKIVANEQFFLISPFRNVLCLSNGQRKYVLAWFFDGTDGQLKSVQHKLANISELIAINNT